MAYPAVTLPAAYTKAAGRGKPQSGGTILPQVAQEHLAQLLHQGRRLAGSGHEAEVEDRQGGKPLGLAGSFRPGGTQDWISPTTASPACATVISPGRLWVVETTR